ncbi:MAG: tyrosine-type recombinase/integrase, partial [Trebonia sp.]
DQHYALLVRTMFATGMRYGELMALKSSDVRDRIVNSAVRGKVIKVSRSVAEIDGKPTERPYGQTAHARRDIPVSDDLAAALVAAAGRDGRIFLNTQGRYIRRSNFGRIWKRAVDAIRLQGMTPHGARHSVASWLANDPSVPLVAVRDMLGHSSIAQTSAYVHYIGGDGDDPRLAALERIAA